MNNETCTRSRQTCRGSNQPPESKTRTYHRQVGAVGERWDRRAGGIRPNATTFAQWTTVSFVLQDLEHSCFKRLFESTNKRIPFLTCRIQNPDIPWAGRVGAAHGGAAGRGRAGQDGTPTDRFAQETTVPRTPKASNTPVLNVSSEARTKEILCKSMGEQKPHSDQRFIHGTKHALRSWLLTSGPAPFCFCKLFSCKACPGIEEGTKPATVNALFAGPRALFVLRYSLKCRRLCVIEHVYDARYVLETGQSRCRTRSR